MQMWPTSAVRCVAGRWLNTCRQAGSIENEEQNKGSIAPGFGRDADDTFASKNGISFCPHLLCMKGTSFRSPIQLVHGNLQKGETERYVFFLLCFVVVIS